MIVSIKSDTFAADRITYHSLGYLQRVTHIRIPVTWLLELEGATINRPLIRIQQRMYISGTDAGGG